MNCVFMQHLVSHCVARAEWYARTELAQQEVSIQWIPSLIISSWETSEPYFFIKGF